MTGLATVVSRIRSDLNRGSDFDARIKEAIANAIAFYRATRFGFNTKRKTNFSISTEFTSLTATWIETDYLKITVPSFLKTLVEENYVLLNERVKDLSLSDEPHWFTIQNRMIRVYPAPDKSYSAEMQFLADLPEVSISASDSASNAWLTEGYELIKTHAFVEVVEMYISDDSQMVAKADRARAREAEIESRLKRRANREQSSGRVRGVM